MNDTYNSYLLSEAWNEKRTMRLKLSGWKCEACGAKQLLQVHHLTYERIFQEPMEDLMVLCRIHHEAAEEMKKKGAIKSTGCVARLRTDTLRLVAPLERYSHLPIGKFKKPKTPKKQKLPKAHPVYIPPPSGVVSDANTANKKMTPQMIRHLIETDPKFQAIMKLDRKNFKHAARKLVREGGMRNRIMSNAMTVHEMYSYRTVP